MEPEGVVRGAEVDPPRTAPLATSTGDPGAGDDAIADDDFGHAVSDFDDTPDELVPEDHRRACEQGAA